MGNKFWMFFVIYILVYLFCLVMIIWYYLFFFLKCIIYDYDCGKLRDLVSYNLLFLFLVFCLNLDFKIFFLLVEEGNIRCIFKFFK